jgi:hypothetical protein
MPSKKTSREDLIPSFIDALSPHPDSTAGIAERRIREGMMHDQIVDSRAAKNRPGPGQG